MQLLLSSFKSLGVFIHDSPSLRLFDVLQHAPELIQIGIFSQVEKLCLSNLRDKVIWVDGK